MVILYYLRCIFLNHGKQESDPAIRHPCPMLEACLDSDVANLPKVFLVVLGLVHTRIVKEAGAWPWRGLGAFFGLAWCAIDLPPAQPGSGEAMCIARRGLA